MEKSTATQTPRRRSKKTQTSAEVDIQAAYIDYVLKHGAQPLTVYKFCFDLGVREDEFYRKFASFDALEKQIWKNFIDRTIASLNADSEFKAFSAHEKFLSFYYTHIEILKDYRSFILFHLKKQPKLDINPGFIRSYKQGFEEFVKNTLAEAKASGQIAERPYVDKFYPHLFWAHLTLLLMFWKDDDTAGFEKTDAFIEKSVNFAFTLVGKGALDSAFDFAKFLYQSRTK